MPDEQTGLYSLILELPPAWVVSDVEVDKPKKQVRVRVDLQQSAALSCPRCGSPGSRHDSRQRRWRHLDTCQYQTIVECWVPRVKCEEHGVLQVPVPWAESNSRFTVLFEKHVIEWLHEASLSAVARQLALSWDQVDSIMRRAVERGLARRGRHGPKRIGIDETSFQKRHEYVTVVLDQESGVVLHVADGRDHEALDSYYQTLSDEELEGIECVSMDMWRAYLKSTRRHVPQAEDKICFDKFHVAKHLGDAVDKVRRGENRDLRARGDDRLVGTKYAWLQHPDRMSEQRWSDFAEVRDSALKTARAWAIKETAMTLWGYLRRGWAERAWKQWLGWASRSKLKPVVAAARMIRKHLRGILNAIVHGATNAASESVNAKIQRVKRQACGYRNRERFRNAIYFHCGGLDLYPDGV